MITASATRVFCLDGGALKLLDLRSGAVRQVPVAEGRPSNILAATDAHVLWDEHRCNVLNLYDGRCVERVALPHGLLPTHACPDPNSDGFLVFGHDRRRHRHGRAYALSTAGELTFLCEVEHLFWADYCRVLPGRVALLSYEPIVAVELGSGLVREFTAVEQRLSVPSAPIVYGRRYTARSFPHVENEFAPTEAYSFADHALFGPAARAAVRTVLLLARLGHIHLPHNALLERLLSYVVRTAARPPPLLTYAQSR